MSPARSSTRASTATAAFVSTAPRRELLERRAHGGAGEPRDEVKKVLERGVAGILLRQRAHVDEEALALVHRVAGPDRVELFGEEVAEQGDRPGRARGVGAGRERVGAGEDRQL